MDAKQEFDQVSKLVKSEVSRFEQERIEDFKNSLEAFLEGMITRQKQVRYLSIVLVISSSSRIVQLIAAWESYQQNLLKAVAPATQRPRVDSVASSSS